MSFLSKWLFGVDIDEEQARQDSLNEGLRQENEADREKFGEAWFREAEANREAGAINDVGEEVTTAFEEGWNDGADNIRGAIGGTVNAVVGTPFKLIPWQVWLIAAVWAFFYFGGLKRVLKR